MLAFLLNGDPTLPEDQRYPIGKVIDFFWRIEFQNRGSPHVHSIWWVEGAPDISTPEGLAALPAYIDKYISTQIPPQPPAGGGASGMPTNGTADFDGPAQSEATEAALLYYYVKRCQQHTHRPTCFREGSTVCRFKYPKPLSDVTRLRAPSDTGLRRTDTYVTKRRPGDESTLPYNPRLLVRWGANMDIQFVGSMYGTAAYITTYITKAETEALQSVVHASLQGLASDATDRQMLQRIGTTILGQREYSLQEAAYLLMGWALRGSGTSFAEICVGYPETRVRVINTRAFRRCERG